LKTTGLEVGIPPSIDNIGEEVEGAALQMRGVQDIFRLMPWYNNEIASLLFLKKKFEFLFYFNYFGICQNGKFFFPGPFRKHSTILFQKSDQ
jgi:hypothetical protein